MSQTPARAQPAATNDPLPALRSATRALHEQLDQNLPLARPDADLADYAMHLSVLRDWQAVLAPWLARTDADTSALALMAADLADCAATGLTCPAPQAVDLSGIHRADDGSAAFCWGMAYVLEGSRLGGQVLYRRLQAQLAPHPLRYLGERGDGSPGWPQFLAALRRKLTDANAIEAGCKGAVAAFASLIAHFRQRGAMA